MGAARPQKIRVLLVDDHQLLTEALSGLLGHEEDIQVVGVAASVQAARAAARSPMDVVLMDYRLPDGTGADATRFVKSRWPNAKVIMLTAVTDDETVLDAIQAGADGYLTKDRASEEVVSAVRAAHAGEILLPRAVVFEIAQRVAFAQRGPQKKASDQLTARELEVLKALSEGLSTRQICDRLYIQPNTLRTHVQNIMSKLRVHSKLEAVAFAIRNRLVDLPRSQFVA